MSTLRRRLERIEGENGGDENDAFLKLLGWIGQGDIEPAHISRSTARPALAAPDGCSTLVELWRAVEATRNNLDR